MRFQIEDRSIDIDIDQLIVAGWTGRDAAAVQHHIDELAEIGVAPPSTTPLFYQVSHGLLTQSASVQVLGDATSGEAEPFVMKHGDQIYLGLASDHTDRELEVTSVAASKQACAKVCAAEVWAFEQVAGHLDQLQLRSWIKEGGAWVLYQDGCLDKILPLTGLMARLEDLDHAAMLCGTLPAIGGVRAAAEFRAELIDPVLKRTIGFGYTATQLDVIA